MIKCLPFLLIFTISCSQPISPEQSIIEKTPPSEKIFDTPESVLWQKSSNSFYVSSIGGRPAEKDGKGWISKLDEKGKVISSKWVDGLNAPKGMGAIGNHLYVSDIDQIVEIDINKGEILRRIDIPDAAFLNDITTNTTLVLISDTGKGQIYSFDPKAGKVGVFSNSKDLSAINGLLLDGDRLIGGSIGNDTLGAMLDISLAGETKIIKAEVGKIDGIVKDEHGYLITDFRGLLLHMNDVGKIRVVEDLTQTRGLKSSADLGYNPETKLVGIPDFLGNKVIFFTIGE